MSQNKMLNIQRNRTEIHRASQYSFLAQFQIEIVIEKEKIVEQ
jgi:hypothetical protein